MTKEQVQALRDAGISEQAIIDRILGEPESKEKPSDDKKEDPKPESKEKPSDDKKENPQPDKADEILAAIDRLTGAIQAGNMRTGRDTKQEQSVEDIMASVLMPAK